jgi:hypothetical protein
VVRDVTYMPRLAGVEFPTLFSIRESRMIVLKRFHSWVIYVIDTNKKPGLGNRIVTVYSYAEILLNEIFDTIPQLSILKKTCQFEL